VDWGSMALSSQYPPPPFPPTTPLNNVIKTYTNSAGDNAVVDGVCVQVTVTVDGEHFVCRVMSPQLTSSTPVDSQQTAQTRLLSTC